MSQPVEFAYDPALLAIERAANELRAGRPIFFQLNAHQVRAVCTVENTTTQTLATFAALAEHHHYLYVSAARARALQLATAGDLTDGQRLPIAGLSLDAVLRLAFDQSFDRPKSWSSGDAIDTTSIQIAKLALLLPAIHAVDIPVAKISHIDHFLVLNDNLIRLSKKRAAQVPYTLVARAKVPLKHVGISEFMVFRGGLVQRDQIAVIVGHPDFQAPVPTRVHSSCLTGDLFASLKCDCGDQLHQSLATIRSLGGGILLYLDQEGRGTGIAAKIRAYAYQQQGLDTIDADAQLGFEADERSYDAAAAILNHLNIKQIHLLSNNPEKVRRLQEVGVQVAGRTGIFGEITKENQQYLRTKATRAGHDLNRSLGTPTSLTPPPHPKPEK